MGNSVNNFFKHISNIKVIICLIKILDGKNDTNDFFGFFWFIVTYYFNETNIENIEILFEITIDSKSS